MQQLQEIQSVYKNRYGETWHLLVDHSVSRALITGNDIDWQQSPVYGGTASILVLSPDEEQWLSNAWTVLERKNPRLGTYGGQQTEFKIGTRSCYLSENVCPLCLKQKKTFDYHHCIASCDGGPDHHSNVLRICRPCHVLLTIEHEGEGAAKERAAFWHQVMHFGFDAFPAFESRGARHSDVSFYERFPRFRELMALYQSEQATEQDLANRMLRREARFRYQHFRDIGLGIWSWTQHFQMATNQAGNPPT